MSLETQIRRVKITLILMLLLVDPFVPSLQRAFVRAEESSILDNATVLDRGYGGGS